MLAKVKSATTIGLDCEEIEVEVDLSSGLPCFNIVGLPDKAVEESKDRVKSAIRNSGANFPQKRITVNLAPGDMKKEGPSFDLPIAIGILAASEQIIIPENIVFSGELALDGHLRKVNGILPIAIMAKQKSYEAMFVPPKNAGEAAAASGCKVYAPNRLRDLILFLRGEKELKEEFFEVPTPKEKIDFDLDFALIKGQAHAKRVLEIAAAGGHNLFMAGPPGSGKTMLAKTLTTILPDLDFEESLEVSKIYSVAGLLPEDKALIEKRPFRNPHHSASDIALVGGGKWPKPGEISLAHRGVLFLDEFPEFPKSVIEMLRQPLEDGSITISRASGSLTFPAKFILVTAQNPCPCGYLNDSVINCVCSPSQIIKYQRKISGPILDRIDIHIDVPRLEQNKFFSEEKNESSQQIKNRVSQARQIQNIRFKGSNTVTNSEMTSSEVKKFCSVDNEGKNLLKEAISTLSLSARAFGRILKVSRTIADLAQSESIKSNHIAEALQYRLRN